MSDKPSRFAEQQIIGIAADTLLPEPGTGKLKPVGPDKFAKVKLTYRVLGSALHDGTRTSVADLIYSDIETVVKFARSYRIERIPIRFVSGDVLKPASPECRYTVVDGNGRVVLAGAAALADGLTFELDLNGALAAGDCTMLALIAVNGNVMSADIRRIPLRISSSP